MPYCSAAIRPAFHRMLGVLERAGKKVRNGRVIDARGSFSWNEPIRRASRRD
jgi:hypothetical protein